MADAKITELAELDATPDDSDLVALVDDPGGSPVTKKITVANLSSPFMSFEASDNLKASANTERTEAGTGYVKIKEIKVKRLGTIRVDFDIKQNNGDPSYTAFGRIYVNGGAVGTIRSTDNTSYVTVVAEDFTVERDDLVQLYLRLQTGGGGIFAYAQNFRLYWDVVSIADYSVDID